MWAKPSQALLTWRSVQLWHCFFLFHSVTAPLLWRARTVSPRTVDWMGHFPFLAVISTPVRKTQPQLAMFTIRITVSEMPRYCLKCWTCYRQVCDSRSNTMRIISPERGHGYFQAPQVANIHTQQANCVPASKQTYICWHLCFFYLFLFWLTVKLDGKRKVSLSVFFIYVYI